MHRVYRIVGTTRLDLSLGIALLLAAVVWLGYYQLARADNDYVSLGAGNCYGQGWASYSTDYGRTWTYESSGNPCQRYLNAYYYNAANNDWYSCAGVPAWSGYDLYNQDGCQPYSYSSIAHGIHNICTVLFQTCDSYKGTTAYR